MVIVADDLTGACDTAAQFADKNYQAVVFFTGGIPERSDETWDVLSFCTDSRSLTGDEAYASVAALLRALPSDKNRQIYKKVDSQLRGNTAHEINALLDVTGIQTAIVAPAFPAQRRTMMNGLINTPTQTVDAAKRLSNIDCPVVSIPLETVRQGSRVMAAKIESISQEAKIVFLADATDDEDLAAIARVPSMLSKKIVLCGSAGLAAQLSVPSRCIARRDESSIDRQAFINTLPVLTVAGSTRVETARQITAASNHYGGCIVAINPALLCGDTQSEEISRCHRALTERLKFRDSVLLFATSGLFSKTDQFPLAGKKKDQGETTVAKAMAEVVSTLLRQHKIGALVLTGGDTALKTCCTLGAYAIHIKSQLLPGIAVGRLVGGFADGMPVVTKSGAFGEKEALIQAIQGIEKFFGN